MTEKVVTNDGVQNTVSKHALGQAIDINPQINPYINQMVHLAMIMLKNM